MESVEVYGNNDIINGVIVGFDPESSGFIYEGDFREKEIEDIGYTFVLEVANIKTDSLVYLPANNNKLAVDEDDEWIPIVENADGLETKTVVIQHPVLESSDIKTRKKLQEEAFEYFDTKYPAQILWEELRGREISCSGVTVNNMVIANFASVKEREEINVGDANIVKNAEKIVQNKFRQNMNDEEINCYKQLKVDNTIMNVSYYVNNIRFGDDCAIKGILELTDTGFQVADRKMKKKREEYELY